MGRTADDRERHSLLFDLEETADLLTTESDELDDVWLDRPAHYAAVGLMLRCQRLVRGMAALVEVDLLDTAATLVRPTLESALTGIWLLRDGSPALEQMMGYDRKQTRSALKQIYGYKPEDLGMGDNSMAFWFKRAEDRDFVPIKDRAGALYPFVQVLYAESQSWIHANLHASYLAFMVDEMVKDRRSFAGLRPTRLQSALREAAVVALLLGRQVHFRIGWGHDDMFDELLEGLGANPDLIQAGAVD